MSKARNIADLLDSNGDVQADALDTQPQLGRRNLIINGGFDVWQRGTSWASATNGQYTVDRWQTFGSSMTCNIDRSTDVPANEGFKYSVKVVRTANGLPFLRQPIEDFATVVVGREWTASFWAKADSACTISVDLGDTGGTTVSIGTTWQRHTVNFPATLSPTYIALDFQSNSSETPMYFTGVQLELGSVATPFEHRSYGEELALCQRYYQKSSEYATNTSWYSDNGGTLLVDMEDVAMSGMRFPVIMRTTPTFTFYVGTTTNAIKSYGGNATRYGTSVYVNNHGLSGIRHDGGYQLGRPYGCNWTADAEL